MRKSGVQGRLIAATVLFSMLGGLTQAAEITGLRVWQDAEHTRAVLDLSGPVEYKLFSLSAPDRVVLDLRKSRFATRFDLPSASGVLKGLRAGRQGRDDARLVLDLAAEVQPRSFLLAPGEGGGHRLVVDLFPRDGAQVRAVKRAEPAAASASARDLIIAVDAGHGGKDPGSIGASGSQEKRITLAVARELKARIDRTPGMQAVLIRDGDHFVPLEERYARARAAKADLFVSIHADAFKNSDARGSSVWVLSPRGASSEAARWLADRENRADLVGGVTLDDKDDILAKVLLDLSQGATMGASSAAAEHVLAALRKLGPTHRDYVERAAFVVLRSPDVPSILVETAFITNPDEEARLKDATHRGKLADAILEGIDSYFRAAPPPGTRIALEREQARRAQPERYIVSRGDTLSGIAARHGLSLGQLRAANRGARERVRVGDVLLIPAG